MFDIRTAALVSENVRSRLSCGNVRVLAITLYLNSNFHMEIGARQTFAAAPAYGIFRLYTVLSFIVFTVTSLPQLAWHELVGMAWFLCTS